MHCASSSDRFTTARERRYETIGTKRNSSSMARFWTTKDVDVALVQAIAERCDLSPLVARVLVARGVTTPEQAAVFLHPSLGRDWSDPALICGMAAVADALEQAIRARRRILVFGDFDVDGISATACMLRGLAALGATADYLIPNRMDEGYGLTAGILERIYDKDPEVLITVDCGISSRDEIAQLLARGISVLVTDHHEPSDATPVGIPVANPKLAGDGPQTILAGVSVALKLMALVGERFDRPELWRDLVDLATLGTLADVMPLTGENRSLVAEGLTRFEHCPRPGPAALLALSQRKGQAVRSSDLAFGIIPRLNAAGRMADPAMALELLISDDPHRAAELACALDAANHKRRETERLLLAETLAQAAELYHGQKILIVAGEGWHEGVRGIVASRLASRYGVPVIVFTLIDGQARGSGRSVGAVNLFRAVESAADLTVRFGGHEAAVGLTLSQDKLALFRERMEGIMAQEPDENLHPPQEVDAELVLGALDVNQVTELGLLEPYGHANREPLFVTRRAFVRNAKVVGSDKNHLSFTLVDSTGSAQAIWFHCPAPEDFIACDSSVDAIYRVQVDEWKGRSKVKLMVERLCRVDEADDDSPQQLAAQQPAAQQPALQQPAAQRPALQQPAAQQPALQQPAPQQLTPQQLAAQIIGTSVPLHPAQSEALEVLGGGASLLAIMATGRGKSLIFQVHAAQLALRLGRASVFIYPLRALIADQAIHLAESFSRLGLKAAALSGEMTTEEKDRVFRGLYEGDLAVLLTTPEFFRLHAWRFAQAQRIAFIVFDEAHHIQTEQAAGRDAYRHLDEAHAHFPHAQYLAVSATSDDRITEGICRALAIQRVVIDDTRRENLRIDDARNLRDRASYLLNIVEEAAKMVIYANSRVQAVMLARLLRKYASSRAFSVAFYHAGLARLERRTIEEGFRTGELRIIISTSAFGEGVNIGDISDVVIYHLPFSAVAFNQMSGRAGRDGSAATIHLLYTREDIELNRRLLASGIPGREELTTLYRALKRSASTGAAVCEGSLEQLTEMCRSIDPHHALDEQGVATGLAIFAELGLLERDQRDEHSLSLQITSTAGKRVELSASSIYLEGREELALFERYSVWAFEATTDELRAQVTGPLVPSTRSVSPAVSDDGCVSAHE
jgi:single-stranded-DNA-specific exonuclease